MKTSTYNIFDQVREKEPLDIFYRLIVVLCAIVLGFAIFTVFWINRNKESHAQILPSFSEALDEGRYKEALEIYRGVHDANLNSDTVDPTLTDMENLVNEKSVTIENRIRYERYSLRSDDIKFLNGMGELTYSHLSNWLTLLCEEFLLGNIEKPDVTFVFKEVSQVDNIEAVATPLLREIDAIEKSRGVAQSAEKKYEEGDYIEAVKEYKTLLDNNEGFVYSFANRRVEEIKEIMYKPMLEKCEHMLDTYQYYSAETILSDLAVIFPDDNRIGNDLIMATGKTSPVTEYKGSVEVLCVRQLIADTEIAFGDSYVSSNDDIYLTTSEFRRILEELYKKNYVLVDAEALIDSSNEEYLVETPLIVPEGKQPLIIVIENLDYSLRSCGAGTCNKLVLNEQGQVCGQYMNASGQEVVQRSAEAVGILDMFVEEHPDFSYNGVRGVISLCGYESVFGYVVSEDEVDDRNLALNALGRPAAEIDSSEIEMNKNSVSEIAAVLKDTGWKFATSTYGNINAEQATLEEIQSDFEKWEDQVGSLLGDTHMIVYPNGNFINGTDPRAEYLKSMGYRVFYGIGPTPYFTYGMNYLYYDRTLLNGQNMRNGILSRLFDVTQIYDDQRVKQID